MKKAIVVVIIDLVISCCLGGCTHVIHERSPDDKDPADQGSVTTVGLRGPKAVISHLF